MKSKKRSGTSRGPLEPLTFFIDRSLGGQIVGQALRDAGAKVELHDDHFQQDAPDVEWLVRVGSHGWAVLTKDKSIRRRPLERDAVINAKLRVFVLAASKGLTGQEMGQTFVNNLRRMERLARNMPAPFIAAVRKDSVELYDLKLEES